MAYRCEICNTQFDEPFIRDGGETIDGERFEKRREVLCPICGSPYFKEESER